MRILLKLELDCPVEAAFDALRDPTALREVFAPLLRVASLEPGGFPRRWRDGDHEVEIRLLGLVPIGRQVIGLRLVERRDGVRMLRDAGAPTSGLLALMRGWEHTLAVSPLPDGRTLYRDRLRCRAGLLAPIAWPLLWAMWQWRGARLQRVVQGRRAPAAE